MAASNSTISGGNWYLIHFTDTSGVTKSVISQSDITLSIKTDGTISGSDGCNQYNGKWKNDSGKFQVSTIITTRMACMSPEGVMDQEQAYLAILGAVNKLSQNGTTLILNSTNGSAELVFQPAKSGLVISPVTTKTSSKTRVTPSPTLNPLEISSWKLISLSPNPDIIESPIKDTRITLTFGTKGKFSGESGCNQYMGTYILKGERLTMSGAVTTRMACMEPEGVMDQETTYLKLLKSVVKQENDGGILTLFDSKGREVLIFTRTVDIPETLIPVTPKKTQTLTNSNSKLLNVKWKWVEQVSKNSPGENTFKVVNPEKYVIQFNKDYLYSMEIDCNIGGGEYFLGPGTLTIKPGFSTLAYCGDDSFDQRFIASLNNVTSYKIDNKGQLNLIMGEPDSIMIFRR